MTTVKLLVLVIGTFLLLAKGKGVEGLDHELPGGEELLPGLEGFEGRQFSSLVGGAPWLQGARHLLSIFGQTRFDVSQSRNVQQKFMRQSLFGRNILLYPQHHIQYSEAGGSTALWERF